MDGIKSFDYIPEDIQIRLILYSQFLLNLRDDIEKQKFLDIYHEFYRFYEQHVGDSILINCLLNRIHADFRAVIRLMLDMGY